MRLKSLAVFAVPAVAFGMAACTVEDEGDGIDVEPANVELEWDTTQVRTPDIDIIPRDTTIPDTLGVPPR